MARRAVAGSVSLVALVLALAASAHAAGPYVRIENATLQRVGDGATIEADVVWNATGAVVHQMRAGTVRVLAIADATKLPTRLAPDRRVRDIGRATRTHVSFWITDAAALAAMVPGNRITLTATQRQPTSGAGLSERSYVTVATLQSFRTPQDRIGRRDCADEAVVLGAQLSRCDLVGADFDHAQLSTRADGTRMLLADLTGATMRTANLSGLSVAGGRLNGANMSDATIDNLSLADAQALHLVARGAQSALDDIEGEAGANIFHTDARWADFSNARLNNVSFGRSRLDHAKFVNAVWGEDGKVGDAAEAEATSFRNADLSGLTAYGALLGFADLTGATLRDATLVSTELGDAVECRTTLPAGDTSDRDCPIASDDGPEALRPLVVISQPRLARTQRSVRITATVSWQELNDLTDGHVLAVAIDRDSRRTTRLFSIERTPSATTTPVDETITDPKLLAAARKGNRVVLTATQHAPEPDTGTSARALVTPATLQPGPGRGRVGSLDCSGDFLVVATIATSCYLPGAYLARLDLTDVNFVRANLDGAVLTAADMSAVQLGGAEMGSVDARASTWNEVIMPEAIAPDLDLSGANVYARMRARTLAGATFTDATITSTTFAGTPMTGATFKGATFTGSSVTGVDLAFTDLRSADLGVYRVDSPASLFMADLTNATLKGRAVWPPDASGSNPPWLWATLCHTTLPDNFRNAVDNRDCPRVPNS
jgi:uncharacterized protein YjbI with pentapeptide repeats